MEKFQSKVIKNPLARTMTLYCFLFAVIFSLCMGSMSFLVYEEDMMNRYHAYTADVLNYVAREIDGDDLQECMKTGKKSAKYLELQSLTNNLKETHALEFLYIIQPLSENPPDNMMDVLAAYTQAWKEAGIDGLTDLGKFTGDAYPPDVARNYLARMDKNPEVTFFPNDTEFGNIYTAIRPVFNSQGEPIAVLCADVLIDEINAGKSRFIRMSVAIAFIAGAILVSFMSFWLKNRVADPIQRIRNSAAAFAGRCHELKDLEMIYFEDPKITTNDELEDLTVALSAMCTNMKAYTEELIQADREMAFLKERVALMDTLAYKDALTGSGNKAAYEKFMKILDWDILVGKAQFAIIMTDLNYLKKINDNFGHDRGNAYIMNMYKMLQENFAESNIFRIGGDEFVVIVQDEHCTKIEDQVANFKATMKEQIENSELEPWERVSAAVGVTYYNPFYHDNANEVFKSADEKMYEDKKAMHAGRE